MSDRVTWEPVKVLKVMQGQDLSVEDYHLWVRGHPVINVERHSVLLRYTDLAHLQELAHQAIFHYARWIISIVTEDGVVHRQPGSESGQSICHYGEGRALILFGGRLTADDYPSLKQG